MLDDTSDLSPAEAVAAYRRAHARYAAGGLADALPEPLQYLIPTILAAERVEVEESLWTAALREPLRGMLVAAGERLRRDGLGGILERVAAATIETPVGNLIYTFLTGLDVVDVQICPAARVRWPLRAGPVSKRVREAVKMLWFTSDEAIVTWAMLEPSDWDWPRAVLLRDWASDPRTADRIRRWYARGRGGSAREAVWWALRSTEILMYIHRPREGFASPLRGMRGKVIGGRD